MSTQDTPITPSSSSLPPQADPVLPVSDLSDVLLAKSAEDLEKKDIPLSIDEFSLDLPDIDISTPAVSLAIDDMPSESLPSAGIKISDSIQTDSLANLVESPAISEISPAISEISPAISEISPAISEVSKQESIAPSQVSVEPLVSEQILENPQQPSPVEEIVLDITPVETPDQSQTSDISNDLGNMMDILPQAETPSESVTQTPTPSESVTQTPTPSNELLVELLPQSQPVETPASSDSSLNSSPLTLDLPQETPKQQETSPSPVSVSEVSENLLEENQTPVMVSENIIPQPSLQEPVVLQDSPSISEVTTSQSPQELPSPIETPVQIIDSQISSVSQSSTTFDIDTLGNSQPSAVVSNITPISQEQVSPQPSMPMPVDIDTMLGTLEKTPSSNSVMAPVGMMFPPQTTMNPGVSGLIAPTSSFTAQPTLKPQTSGKKTSILSFILTLLLAVGGRFFAQTMWPIETQALLDEAKSIIQPYLGGASENVSSNTGSLAEGVSIVPLSTGDENTIIATGEEISASGIVDTGSLLSSGSVESTGKVHNAADITGQNISEDSKLKDLEEVFIDTSLSGQITVLKTMVTQTTELLKKGKELQDREIVRNALYVRKKSQELLDQLEKGTQMDTKELTNKIQTLQPFLDKAKQASLDVSQTSPTSSTGMSQ